MGLELAWGDKEVCQEELISTVLMFNIIQKKTPKKSPSLHRMETVIKENT